MSALRELGLKQKLTGAASLIFALVAAFIILFFPWTQQRQMKKDLAEKALALGRMAAQAASAGVMFEDKDAVAGAVQGLVRTPNVVFVSVLDGNGVELFTFATTGSQPGWNRGLLASLGQEGISVEEGPFWLAIVPVQAVEKRIGSAEKRIGSLVVGLSKDPLLADVARSRRLSIFVGIAILVLGFAIIWILASRIVQPLREAVRAAGRVAEGDLEVSLSADMLQDAGTGEVGQLLRAMNKMTSELRRMVGEILETSAQVASAAGQISASTKQITRGAQSQVQAAEETSTSMVEMAASIQVVAGNAGSLASHVEETSASVGEMGASMEQVARSNDHLASTVATDQIARNLETLSGSVTETSATIEQMASSIDAVARNAEVLGAAASKGSRTVSEMAGAVSEVAKIAEEADRMSRQASEDASTGGRAVASAVAGMKTISENMENTARVITGLGSRSQEIGKILEAIEEIADQTNLLALNAAIEAARAGDAGRGFAVVADEVRKLAQRSVEATKEIGEVVRQVQQGTTDAVETANSGASEAKQGIRLADEAGLALSRIIESVSRSSQLMAQIASATAKQSEAAADVLQTVADMNKATEQVTGAVREQVAGSRQIRQAVERINQVTGEVTSFTREQAAGGRRVLASVEGT